LNLDQVREGESQRDLNLRSARRVSSWCHVYILLQREREF
jgi:hypothetical protein